MYEPILRTVEEESAQASVISKASSRWRRQSSAEDSDKGERLYPKRVRFLVNPAWLWGCWQIVVALGLLRDHSSPWRAAGTEKENQRERHTPTPRQVSRDGREAHLTSDFLKKLEEAPDEESYSSKELAEQRRRNEGTHWLRLPWHHSPFWTLQVKSHYRDMWKAGSLLCTGWAGE